MKGLNVLAAFLGGAAVGAAIGILFAPEKGEVPTTTSRSIPVIPINASVSTDDNIVEIIFTAPLGEVKILVDGQVQEVCQVTARPQKIHFYLIPEHSKHLPVPPHDTVSYKSARFLPLFHSPRLLQSARPLGK